MPHLLPYGHLGREVDPLSQELSDKVVQIQQTQLLPHPFNCFPLPLLLDIIEDREMVVSLAASVAQQSVPGYTCTYHT